MHNTLEPRVICKACKSLVQQILGELTHGRAGAAVAVFVQANKAGESLSPWAAMKCGSRISDASFHSRGAVHSSLRAKQKGLETLISCECRWETITNQQFRLHWLQNSYFRNSNSKDKGRVCWGFFGCGVFFCCWERGYWLSFVLVLVGLVFCLFFNVS